MKRIRSAIIKIAALCLALLLAAPIPAKAAQQEPAMPCASQYISSYSTYICRVGNQGEIQIWFDVVGTSTLDEIGVHTIKLYEVSSDGRLILVKLFSYIDCDTLFIYNSRSYTSYVSYMGSVDKTYKAYVCFWGSKDGNSDSFFVWAT